MSKHQYGHHVLKLRQYGKGGWKETPGRLYQAIVMGENFQTGQLRGWRFLSDPFDGVGRLDDKYRVSVAEADYVIYSYATPIAWHTPREVEEGGVHVGGWWVFPEESYSATTTRHQGIVRVALSLATILPYDV